jgi:hypothetical protein
MAAGGLTIKSVGTYVKAISNASNGQVHVLL